MYTYQAVCGGISPPTTKTTVKSVDENEFQQTLIYNGMVGKKINVAFNEFSNKLARAAFSNDVEYDLSQSKIIGYEAQK